MLSILRGHSIREQREENFKAEVAEKEKLLNEAKSQAKTEASKHATHVEELMNSLNKLKAEKEAAEGDAKRAAEEAKEVKTNLEARVDMAEAKTVHAEAEMKRAQDALAKLEAEIEDKINAGKDELVDLSMYRVWEHN